MGKPRICCIIPSLNAGGMERVMSELLEYFAGIRNTDMHLVMYGKYPSIFYPMPKNLTIHKPGFNFNDTKRLWYTIKTISFIRKTIKTINPDTILSFGELWNSLVLISLAGTGYPVYISDRCQPNRPFGFMHGFLRKVFYPQAKGIISQTTQAKEIYFRKFKHPNISVIGNPIRLPGFDQNDSHRDQSILTVGRLIHSKHHDRLITMFGNLDTPGWKLKIVGGNALRQDNFSKLTQLVTRMGLDDRVLLTGEVKNVAEYYQTCRIFAFTSSSEGFPNVVLEALAYGMPVVAYDCTTGPSEMVIDGYNGYLVPLHDEETFSKRLQTLVDNPELLIQMSENASRSVEQFDMANVGEKFHYFITSHLDQK
jgi:glycosyltransferase involved in cell wall biosynthesis